MSAALTYQGLKALGVPQDSLDSFPPEFQQGMAARAAKFGDTGENAPEHWEKPFGTPDIHVGDQRALARQGTTRAVLARARQHTRNSRSHRHLAARLLRAAHRGGAFGFRDGISHPAIEGSGIPGTNSKEPPLKAGEFLLGYLDETGGLPLMPQPEVLGRNGTYVVFRKLHQRVAAFRQYLTANSSSSEEEKLLAAKMMGRWHSGAPLALCPTKDDPAVGSRSPAQQRFPLQGGRSAGA